MDRPGLAPDDLLTHLPFVRRLARALCDDPHDAADLAQETWSRALRKSPRDPADLGAVRGWLARVMRSAVRELRRSDVRRERREQVAAAAELQRDPDPAHAAARLESMRALVVAVAQLDDPWRSVLLERYFDEIEPAEIARRRAVPVATVHTWLHRGRAKLRARLTEGDDPAAGALLMAGLERLAGEAPRSAAPTGAAVTWTAAGVVLVGVLIGATLLRSGIVPSGSIARLGDTSPASAANAPSRVSVEGDALHGQALAPALSTAAVRNVSPVPGLSRASCAVVVRQEDGVALAGVEVHFRVLAATPFERERVRLRFEAAQRDLLGETEGDDRRACMDWLVQQAAPIPSLGVTDEDGAVTLPPFECAVVAIAHAGRQLVRLVDRDEPVPCRFELEPPPPLHLRVLDRAGIPVAGASVGLRPIHPTASSFAWLGRTGLDGLASVESRELRYLAEWLREIGTDRMTASLVIGGARTGSVEVDLEHLPAEPIDLTLPPCGTLRVEVLDELGRPFRGPALVGVREGDSMLEIDTATVGMAWRRVEEGAAVFDRVGLGLDLTVTAVDRSIARAGLLTTVPGPMREGEAQVAGIRLGPPFARVRGSIVDAGRNPLREWRCRARYSLASAPHDVVFATDDTGRFEFSLVRYGFENDDTSRIPVDRGQLTLVPEAPELLDPALAEAAIVLDLACHGDALGGPGLLELGVLELGSPAVVAAGKVVDDAGAPVARLDVAVETKLSEVWRRIVGISARTDSAGRFALRGHTAHRPLRLVVRGASSEPIAPFEFEPGARDLVVVARTAPAVVGRLLVDEGIALEQLVLRPSEELLPMARMRAMIAEGTPPVMIAADGKFRIVGLEQCAGAIEVGLGDGMRGSVAIEPLLRFEGVAAGSGESDPRLAAVDLRRRLRSIEVFVVDEERRPIGEARVDVTAALIDRHVPATSGCRRFLADRDGRVTLVAAAPSYAISACKAGYEPATAIAIANRCEVILRRP